MPISTEGIINLYHQRRKLMDPRILKMQEVKAAVNGDIVVPLPELDRSERPMVANLIDSGLNQHAMRIASTMPDVRCQPLRPGIQLSEDRANDRRAAILGWWSMNRLGIIQRQRARFFVGYAMAPVVIRHQPINPSARKRSIPIWQWRDPLTTFPPPGDELDPPDCFTGDTEFITKEFGVVPFGEMAGQVVTVLTRDGWAKGEVRHFGRRSVQRVTFAPANICRGGATWSAARSNHRVSVTTTIGHRWPLVDGSVTTALTVGDTVHAVASQATEDQAVYEEGFRHGLIFGDGSAGWIYANGDRDHSLRLCGDKARFTAYFERVNYPPSANGDPVCWLRRSENLKEFPVGRPVDYLRGFVDGWVATDGCDLGNGTIRVASQNPQAGDWLSRNAAVAGWVMRGWHVTSMTETNFGNRGAPLHEVSLVRQGRAAGWKVVSVEQLPEQEDLYCAVVPGPEMFALASGVYTGNCIFAFAKTLRWLRAEYPAAGAVLARRDASPDDRVTVVEYVDDEVNVLAALSSTSGDPDPLNPMAGPSSGVPYVELEREENLAGICTAVVPGRICLDRRQGQFDGLIGLYWWQSKIMALEGIAMERDIFPDEYFIGRPGENPQIITQADGRAGVIGEASGGVFDRPGAQSNIPAYQTLDRIERSMRLTGGIPAELGGESASNIRTGRRGGQVLSSAIDFSIQEAQQVMEASLEEENVRAIAIDKAYYGSRRKAFYFSWNGKSGRGDYTPAETWETDENTVSYSFAGADVNQQTVAIGQLIGMELMSHHRGMELNPMVEDPEAEERRILAEKLEAASISGFQTGLADGTIPISDGARVYELVAAKKMPFYAAVAKAQKEAQERQASAGPPGAPDGPVPPGAPEAQPGLAAPGMGAEAPEAIPEGAPSLQNLSQMLTTLRRPNTQATV